MDWQRIPKGVLVLAILNIIIGIPFILVYGLGLIPIALGIGLLKLKPWAWKLYMVMIFLTIVIVLFGLPDTILAIIIYALLLLYLDSAGVRDAFGTNQMIGQGYKDSVTNLPKRIRDVFHDRSIEHADELFGKEKISAANKIYDYIVETSDEDDALASAYFGLGNIAIHGSDRESAFQNYKKARRYGHPLNEDSILLIGNCYAEQGSKTADAVEIYLEYIKYRVLETTDELVKKVYALLESVCQIGEQDSHLLREEAMDRNRVVIDANSRVGWAYCYLGIGHLCEGDTDKAIDHLEKAHKLEPQRALTCYYFGKTYLEINETERALSAFRRSLELGCEDKDALFQVARILLTQEEVADEHVREAIGYLKDAIKLDGKSEYYYYIGLAYSLCDYHSHAKENLKHTILVDDGYLDAYRLMARICFKHDEFEEAEPYLRKIRSIDGKDKEARLLLGCLLYELERFDEAVLELEPVARNDRRGLYSLARSCSKTDRFDRAIDHLTHFIDIFGEGADSHYYIGCAHANLGGYDDAMQAFSQSLELEKQSRTHLQRGNVFLAQDQLEGAYTDYMEGLSQEPDNAEIIYALGNYWYRVGDNEQALSCFNRTIELDPTHVHAHTGRGLVCEMRKGFPHAMQEYEFATRQECKYALPYMRLGILYHDQRDYSKSLESLHKAQQYGDEGDALLYYLGSASVHTERFKEGLDIWKKLYERYPEDKRLEVNIYKSHYCLGRQYILEQKHHEAIVEWEEYIRKYDEDITTRVHLADVYFREFFEKRDADKLERAIKLNYDDRYRYYASLCDIAGGEYEKAISVLRQLLQNDSNPRLEYHLGLAMLKIGERDKAIEMLKEVISADNGEYRWHASTIISNEYIKEERFSNAAEMLESALEKGGYADAD